MEYETILYTKDEGIATITLNRPETLNAFNAAMLDEWYQAIEDARDDPKVRVVVVTGAGRGFCSGIDIRAREEGIGPTGDSLPYVRRNWARNKLHKIPRALESLDKPYIASINGAAIGGGMEAASMADIRIASDRARFGMQFTRRGLVPGDGGCYWLPRIVGTAKALELIWANEIIDAQEALRIGYVSQVLPHDELAAATKELALKLAKGSAVAIQMAKRLLYQCLDLDLDKALELHEQMSLVVSTSPDVEEGARSWAEKREPEFTAI
ncbi:MAG: enoyl-CoA hydratase/isomerase family protein [Chloroflexi bacterium]|nr:enoyl-CoA hydratase/isomerase family protein [Chloroflexota bacterium]